MSNALLKYSFYDTKTQTIIENLSWSQSHSLCRYLFKNGHEHFYIHVSNEKRWVPLSICIEDLLKITKDLLRTIPVPNDHFEDKTVVNHQMIDAPLDRRQFPRYPKKIDLTLDIGGLLKKASTEDISLNGMKLDSYIEVPTNLQFAMAYVKCEGVHIEFKIKPILKDKKFNAFALISCNNLSTWKALVEKIED